MGVFCCVLCGWMENTTRITIRNNQFFVVVIRCYVVSLYISVFTDNKYLFNGRLDGLPFGSNGKGARGAPLVSHLSISVTIYPHVRRLFLLLPFRYRVTRSHIHTYIHPRCHCAVVLCFPRCRPLFPRCRIERNDVT